MQCMGNYGRAEEQVNKGDSAIGLGKRIKEVDAW